MLYEGVTLNLLIFLDIRNKRFCKVKNIQVWVALSYFEYGVKNNVFRDGCPVGYLDLSSGSAKKALYRDTLLFL